MGRRSLSNLDADVCSCFYLLLWGVCFAYFWISDCVFDVIIVLEGGVGFIICWIDGVGRFSICQRTGRLMMWAY